MAREYILFFLILTFLHICSGNFAGIKCLERLATIEGCNLRDNGFPRQLQRAVDICSSVKHPSLILDISRIVSDANNRRKATLTQISTPRLCSGGSQLTICNPVNGCQERSTKASSTPCDRAS